MQALTLDYDKIAELQAQSAATIAYFHPVSRPTHVFQSEPVQPLKLDYSKIAALQQWSVELQSRFPVSAQYAAVQR